MMRKYSKMLLSVINSFFFFMRRKLGCTKKNPKHHPNSDLHCKQHCRCYLPTTLGVTLCTVQCEHVLCAEAILQCSYTKQHRRGLQKHLTFCLHLCGISFWSLCIRKHFMDANVFLWPTCSMVQSNMRLQPTAQKWEIGRNAQDELIFSPPFLSQLLQISRTKQNQTKTKAGRAPKKSRIKSPKVD